MDRPSIDRRKYPRVNSEIPVLVRRIARGEPHVALGMDLGIVGLRLQCDGLDLELDDVIEATLDLGHDSVVVVGKVIRVTDLGETQEVALKFEQVIDAQAFEHLCEPWLGDENEGA